MICEVERYDHSDTGPRYWTDGPILSKPYDVNNLHKNSPYKWMVYFNTDIRQEYYNFNKWIQTNLDRGRYFYPAWCADGVDLVNNATEIDSNFWITIFLKEDADAAMIKTIWGLYRDS